MECGDRFLNLLKQRRLVHVLIIAMMVCVAVPVALMGGAMFWQLQRGFDKYLQEHDTQRLARMARTLEQIDAVEGTSAWLHQPWGQTLERLSRQLRQEDNGFPAPHGPAGLDPGPPDERPSAVPDGLAAAPGHFPDLPPRRNGLGGGRPAPPESMERRLTLLDVQGRVLGGMRPDGARPHVRQAVYGQDGVVAYLQLQVVRALPDALGQRFLREQYTAIAVLALLLLMLAALLAVLLARRMARPLQSVSEAASRIAAGDLAARIVTVRGGTGMAELDALMHHINQMAHSLQAQQHRQNRWIADISHELRTPLAVLQGEVEALIDGIRVRDVASMQSLREELLRIGALVQDLHLLSLADLQALPCDFQDGDAWACVLKVVQRFELRAQIAGIRLQCHRTDPGPLKVSWDFQRMSQVLGNLIDNSLNYTRQPGHMHLHMQALGDCVQITVEDSAPGVRDEDLSRLLDPLYRAQSDRARAAGRVQSGSGLGLSIVRVLVQAHSGQVDVTHSVHGGLKVVITMPRVSRS